MSYGSLHNQGPKNGTGIFSWGDRTDMHKVGSNVEEGSQQYFKYGEHKPPRSLLSLQSSSKNIPHLLL